MKRILYEPAFPFSEEAASALRKGGVIAFPTDTAYGLGADPLNEEACETIYVIKDRAPDQPLILLGDRIEDFLPFCRFSSTARKLAARFWPGGLTLILSAKETVPSWVNRGKKTIGVRIPDCDSPREISRLLGRPLATTSANRSGQPSPRSGDDVFEQLKDTALILLLDGGPTSTGLDSTLVDLSGKEWKVLRQGGVSPESLREVLGKS
ncbi:MAG TPA: threonylcarbamoyl-AMP synthase [Cyanobacteria bacterium UBA8530]|nr:threonylcarbamoyl-AMP synthase [Cyanobacteria bacterium UBA8530]